jgi:hypothetical protein
MEFKFLKFCIGLCLLLTFVLFVAIEYSFPIDVVSYASSKFNRTEFEVKLWLQAVSLFFLWFAGLFGLLLFAKTPTKSENNTNNP